MAVEIEPDFGGYATKAGLRCTDGRTIKAAAFQHMDGKKVPLVWQHGHSEASNILGHALLQSREDGVYAYGFFNSTPNGQHAKKAVAHGDLDSLSIWANGLKELNKNVSHGNIKEVSLVLSGANPGAKIDQIKIQHGSDEDDYTELEDEAIIHTGDSIDLPEDDEASVDDNKTESDKVETIEHAEGDDGETVKDIYDSMNEKQKNVTHYMIGAALDEASASAEHADTDEGSTSDDTDEGIAHQEGNDSMTRNLFESQGGTSTTASGYTAQGLHYTDTSGQPKVIAHAEIEGIFADGMKRGSFKEAVNDFVLAHGITNVELLFPDAQAIANTPEFDKRRTEWVSTVLAGTRHTPFAKIKTLSADLTQDAARAKGYIKGNYKIEEWFGVTKRTTGPTTVYKKQKLERDDMLDITDFDVVAWLMAEMRIMLEEEIARAILLGDGRDVSDVDKIKDPLGASDGTGIRSILNDHELFVTTLTVNVADALSNYEEVIDAVMDGFEYYKGTGSPTFFTTVRQLNMFKKAKDGEGRRYYKNNAEVAEALGVDKIVTVEPMNEYADVIGIIVNLADYNVGTNKGGEITDFEQFDIDYNNMKYLLETRLSGALIRVKTALVIRSTAAANVLATPVKPSFVASTGVVTIPTVTGVVYKNGAGTTLTAGAQTAIPAGTTVTTYSVPASGYYFADTVNDSWPFTRPAA
jgi:phage head maturation protease